MTCGCKNDIAIPAGELRHKVEIYSRGEVDTPKGGQTLTWTLVRSAWCKIEQVTAGEPYRRMKLQTETTHVFSGRYADLSIVTPRHKLRFQGVDYNVRDADNVEFRNITMVIQADSGVTQ